MNKQLVIPCSRMVHVLNEGDLISGLKPETLERGIRKGKRYRIPEDAASLVETMNIKELREGVAEYLLSLPHNSS